MKHVAPAFAAILLASTPAFAQTYPDRPIRVIVPNAAGSWADAAGRVVLRKMGELLNGTFLTVNSSKALGTIGLDECMKAEPDGYTLCQANFGHMVALAASSIASGDAHPYDLWKQLVPVGEIAETQYVLMTSKSVPATTLDEFVAFARSSPEKLTFATHGPSSVLIAELLESALHVGFVEIPYGESGEPQATSDLLAGRVQVKVGAVSTMMHYANDLHVLGVFGGKGRSPFFPDLPSMLELGYSGFGMIASWSGLWAPLGTSPEVVRKLNAALVQALGDPEVKKVLGNVGMVPRPGVPEHLGDLHAPVAPLAEFMKERGISIFPK